MHNSARSKSSQPHHTTRAKSCHMSRANARQYNVRKLRTMSTRGPLCHCGVHAPWLAAKKSFGDCEGKLGDILRRLQLTRTIPGTLFDLEARTTLGHSRRHGMDRSNKKGGSIMNCPQVYALGLLHGGLLLAFVWLVWPKNRRK